MRRCAVSVDLDEIHHYQAIHGLTGDDVDRNAVYDVAIARLVEWAKRRGMPLTLFTVGSDLEREQNRALIAACARDGHEIASHSFSHAYDLTRRSEAEIGDDIQRSVAVIRELIGERPQGFRAPGYATTDALYRVLQQTEFRYSSSVFPCPGYYAAKALAIGWKAARGRRSSSIVDDPRVLLSPPSPYRVGAPYWTKGSGMLEIPIQTTRFGRLPFIGTSLTLAGPSGARALTRMVAGSELVNLELHGVDVLDAADGLTALAAHQHDLRVPVERKLAALNAALDELVCRGYEFCTLAEAAERWPES